MSTVLDDFYTKVMNELLNKDKTDSSLPVALHINNGIKKNLAEEGASVDFNTSAETYKNAIDYVETSVENMTKAAQSIRTCSGEKIKQNVSLYIESVQASSFRTFNKEAADNEFVANAKQAILLNLQSQVLLALDEAYEQETSGFNSNPQADNLYVQQREAVLDIEQFEIMIVEIMRQKYVSLTNQDIDYDTFAPIYDEIFRSWCLNYENEYNISLEELSTAAINQTAGTISNIQVRAGLTVGEIVTLVAFGSAILILILVVVILKFLDRKKGAVI